jgi:hypothetical protein
MAILDNSGDIILDCVLTELGRKRMSNGQFQISKFGLGDDEIDYAIYQKNHISGSAYYDLQILQTPILEAFTQRNASINYGLMTISNNNILYMPTIKRNTLIQGISLLDKHRVIYLAIDDGTTYDLLVTLFGGAGTGAQYVMQAGATTGTKVILESGLDTSDIPGTPSNKQNYLVSQGLQNAQYQISVDNRFFSSVIGPGAQAQFNNNGGNGQAIVQFNPAAQPLTGIDSMVRNHSVASVRAINNNVIFRTNDNRADTQTSAIKGPRATATALSFGVRTLNADMYSRYGMSGQTLTGDVSGNTYSYIDSTVFVRSQFSEHQLTVRVIKKD